MSIFEREKARHTPKRVDLNSCATGSSTEQSKQVKIPVESTSVDSPGVKSTDSDTDRRKFFESLLQSKNGPKVETALPKMIPEESESNADSPVKEGEKTSDEDSNNTGEKDAAQDVIPSKSNGDEALEPSEVRPSKVEDSLSATGVSSEVRGAEVAGESVNQSTDVPDKGLNVEIVGESEAAKTNVTDESVKEGTDTESVENATKLPSPEDDKVVESNKGDKSDELVDESKTLPSTVTEESDEALSTNAREKRVKFDDRTASESHQAEQLIDNSTNSNEGQDLLDEKDKPKDVDSSLTIAVKSSYIGGAVGVSEDTQTNSENKDAGDGEEKQVPSEGVAESEEQAVLQSKETDVQKPSVESLPVAEPSQSGSPSSPVKTGTESSPSSTPSAASAATSNASSPDQKSTYRAHVNIPEYLWSPVHQRLLGDLLFAVESDVQVWRR